MSKHTPGPWVAIKWDAPKRTSIERMSDPPRFVAVVYGMGAQVNADAALIEAAPKMYAALQWIIDHGDTSAGNRPASYAMRAHARLTLDNIGKKT